MVDGVSQEVLQQLPEQTRVGYDPPVGFDSHRYAGGLDKPVESFDSGRQVGGFCLIEPDPAA